MKNWPFFTHLTRDELVLVNAPLVLSVCLEYPTAVISVLQLRVALHLEQTVILVGKEAKSPHK